MSEASVRIVEGTPIRLFVPGPNASTATLALTHIRDLAVEALRMMRYADDAEIKPVALDVIEEALHKATRPMRHGFTTHTRMQAAEFHAQQFADAIGTDTETANDEPASLPAAP